MKHLALFENYADNIVEGINYNGSRDADLPSVGLGLAKTSTDVDKNDDKALAALAINGMKKSKPVPLTGKIKEDAAKLIKYVVDTFKKQGVELDGNNAIVYSPHFVNQIEIPVAGEDDLLFQTFLDYEELAHTNPNFIVSGDFSSDDEGLLGFFVEDLNNNGQIVKSASEFKKYIETKNS